MTVLAGMASSLEFRKALADIINQLEKEAQ
jgi:hypothetical protein